jgi:hypothetical protein
MPWTDATDVSYWDQTNEGRQGSWSGTSWVPDDYYAENAIRQYFKDGWMDGQRPVYWRFTVSVSSGAQGDEDDFSADVGDYSYRYNWDTNVSVLDFALSNGNNEIQDGIFIDGGNSHLGDLWFVDFAGRATMSYTITKIEFLDSIDCSCWVQYVGCIEECV